MQTDLQDELAKKEAITPLDKDEPHEPIYHTTHGGVVPNGWNLLSASRLRRGFQSPLRLHEFLLDYNINFLPYLGCLLWGVYLFVQIL